MPFETLDYLVVAGYVVLMIAVAWAAKVRGQESLDDFFAGGKNLPWWLVGVSMVATTFAADTPLAITGLVAEQGIAGNWFWWNWMISGIVTVFIYAKLWKRADVLTDVEFIELRYGGKPASFLRGFRALYFAFPFNCIIMGWVTVGMAKILTVVTGADQWIVILILYGLIALYIAISGLWGVIVTDFVQFILAMIGTIALAYFAVDHIGGLAELKTQLTQAVDYDVLSFNPFTNPKIAITTALIWLGMNWWAAWYPGAEPGGGGYIAQRMFSAKDEKNAVGGTLLFNILMYAVRPWPWILVALVAMVVFPNLEDPETGYPLMMLEVLPVGWMGLLMVAFLSAFVSTISTQLNWGTSYVVNDFYKRFMKTPEEFASKEKAQKHYVFVSRIATLLMAALGVGVSYFFDSVSGGWEFILSLSAGIGGVLLLRWFWWRINAWSEITAMIAAMIGAIFSNQMGYDFAASMIFTTTFSTIAWLIATFITKPESEETLRKFYAKVHPMGNWKKYSDGIPSPDALWPSLINIAMSLLAIFFYLYGLGQIFFFNIGTGIGFLVGGSIFVWAVVRRI
ncbi:sodium:solute symporter family protein [Gracilimonas mengyeensis]|uniref:Transporter, SSS family n=1 Tax=Gracilimonas mengyeensis TaxID=1302730 RepID=A0A521CVU0_9BACT|nr:sodium:solute symporter family protein [Gracilimonas mengyeensis]SMO63555.1 transporter, SSS family [Gracilimonas mengyeensis]